MRAGLFSAAAGMIDNAQRLDTIVHNLANVHTTGYKRHIAMSVPFTRFLDETLDDIEGAGGEILAQQHIRYSFCNGTPKFTGRCLDVALQDKGDVQKGESCAFFNVRAPAREVRRPKQYLIDRENYLVEAQGADGREFGPRALNIEGKEVHLPDGTGAEDVYINPDGFVYLRDSIYDQVRDHQLVATLDPGIQYTRNGNFQIQTEGDASYLVTADGFRVQGRNGDIRFDKNVRSDNMAIDREGRIFVSCREGCTMRPGTEVDQLKISHMKDVPFQGELRFRLDQENYVVNARNRRIVDVQGRFIVAPSGTSAIGVTPDGQVHADGRLIAHTLERPGTLTRGEDEPLVTQTRFGYYVPTDEFVAIEDTKNYETHNCYLEQSNVDVISELGQMIITMRAYEADAKMVQAIEQNLQQLTNSST
jgi:flagellar basal body rod protein FlgG